MPLARQIIHSDQAPKAIGPYSNKGTQEFVAPSRGEQEDWVLVLDAMP